ncbi:MAG: S1 family peptidase [Proteobacteria bacterium]|nr:S1 family peptidase [Pseudomonadota bacterium]
MKDTFRIIIILSIVLSACQETEMQSTTEELAVQSQPILYGVLDKDEPYVVSLFLPDHSESHPTMCNEKNIAACQQAEGTDTTCIYSFGTHVCAPICQDSDKPAEDVCIHSGNYFYTATRRCMDVDGTSVFTEDYSKTTFCNQGCNDDETACDSSGESIYTICDSQNVLLCKQYYGYGYTCVQERFDDSWCATTCSTEGTETKKCERTESGYRTSLRKCTQVSGKLVNITQDSYACDGACNADGTDCIKRSKPTTPIIQSLGSSYCTGTLIHPEWILTAAHCVTDDETGEILPMSYNEAARIGFGYSETSLKLYDTKGPDYFYFHPEYSGTLGDEYIRSDIALVKLKAPIPSSVAEPVLPLPPWLAFSSADLPAVMDTSGFGYDENGNAGTKLKISLATTHYCGKFNPDDPIHGECSVGKVTVKGCHPNPMYCSYYGSFNETFNESIPYGTIFAPIYEGGQCNGDSGGPTFYTVGDKRYVVGITSYGDAPCRGYNVATSVQDFYEWILEIAPEVAEQYVEVCDNGLDDDNNGLIDKDDPNCEYCGNHAVNANEMCDDTSFADDKTSCAQWDSKYISGDVSCKEDCTINFDACIEARCGDSLVNLDEVCDGDQFKDDESSCHALFPDLYSDGNVSCTDTCTYDTSACIPYCGNGSIDADEACDHSISGDIFPKNADSCEKIVGKGSTGTLTCSDDCKTIISANCSEASRCGDGILNDDEACDHSISGDVFPKDADTCEKLVGKGSTGTPTCSDDCQTILSANCSEAPRCGNGILNDGEACDGNLFANNKVLCSQWGTQYTAGSVQCLDDCTLDFSNCQTASAPEVEICGNQMDDDHNGLTDCEDPMCANLVACQSIIEPPPSTPEPPEPEEPKTKKASDSDCSSTPLTGNVPPIGMLLLGLLGLRTVRRRKDEQ